MKTSKIKTIHGEPKPFTNNYGTTYYHNLEMENGDKINIGKKSQCQVGWELTYELTGEDDGQQEFKKAKSAKKEEGSYKGSGDLKGIKIGHAITNAVVLYCAKGHSDIDGNGVANEIKHYAKMILEISDELNRES